MLFTGRNAEISGNNGHFHILTETNKTTSYNYIYIYQAIALKGELHTLKSPVPKMIF